MIETSQIWIIIISLAIGSWLLRFSFLGLLGRMTLPPVVQRHLRYTVVAVLPGIVAPLVVMPQISGGTPDPARIIAAAVTIGVGVVTRSFLAAILCGVIALYSMLYLGG